MTAENADLVQQKHRLISAHRCSCGWEGDDAIIHAFDAIQQSGFYLLRWGEVPPWMERHGAWFEGEQIEAWTSSEDHDDAPQVTLMYRALKLAERTTMPDPAEYEHGSGVMDAETIMRRWRPGSYDFTNSGRPWSWADEEADIGQDEIDDLADKVQVNGFTEPVLLGDDGRVWDGHHRIIVGRTLALPVPFEMGHSQPGWDHGQRRPIGRDGP